MSLEKTNTTPAMALAGAMQMVLADPIVAPFMAEDGHSMAITSTAGGLDGAATLGAISPGGTGYVDATNVATTGGTGTGLTIVQTGIGGMQLINKAIADEVYGSGVKVIMQKHIQQ